MRHYRSLVLCAATLLVASGWGGAASAQSDCPSAAVGITLSPGFCATIFADAIGHVRHMAVNEDGTLYAITWSGRYYQNDPPPAGGMIVAMADSSGSGHADIIERFGPSHRDGAGGGTGIAIFRHALYAEIDDKILRFPLSKGERVPRGAPELVVSGLPLTGSHPMHPFVIGQDGALFVDSGSATNVCESGTQTPPATEAEPCAELATRAGIWRYDATGTDQKFSPSERFATGLRNGEGLSFDAAGRLFATQHGRDRLAQNWPQLYSLAQGADLPAEELVQLRAGGDYGWPYCYYDQNQQRLVLAPEYGGDGGKTAGVCATKQSPVAAFPGHWAPNDLLISLGTQFPPPYRGGAFIAFHGSWNRAPLPQGGYLVAYQPLADGKASGPFVVFADGFAGAHKDPGGAAFRPTGLAMGPDGALYISDDKHGRIWRVTYHGDAATAKLAPAPSPQPADGPASDNRPSLADLPLPRGASRDQIALGDRVFHGEASGGNCSGCHGGDARGSSVGPSLRNGQWVNSDGRLGSIRQVVAQGVAHPKNFTGPMPPKGGAPLTEADIDAVAAYVWAVGHAR